MIQLSEKWRSTYSGASLGILAMANVSSPKQHEGLSVRKTALEQELRERYAGFDRERLKTHPVLAAYNAYYKRFKKTYHVQLQLESIAFKGKSLPNVAALVEAMFMAEMNNLMLTAGHDLDVVQPPVTIDVAEGHETYIKFNGQEQTLKTADMYIADTQGILSSIIYGPDQRTQITPGTQRVIYTVYGAPGINEDDLKVHLVDIQENVLLISPNAVVDIMEVYSAQ